MSKQRPSDRRAASVPARPRTRGEASGRPWLKHVFHNTYTRKGRRIAVRSWSVKLQHQGVRRTFTLAAATRRAAADEARAIHDTLMSEGWGGVTRLTGQRPGRARSKMDARYWQERLLFRKAPGERPHELSVRLEHGGVAGYFPLGVTEPEAAACGALAIYHAIIQHGWKRAWKLFSREVTLGFHWGHDPLLWTYATLHTVVDGGLASPGASAERNAAAGQVRVIEDDPGIRVALEQWVNRGKGTAGNAVLPAKPHPRAREGEKPILCLMNRDLVGRVGLSNPGRIGLLPDGIPALTYGVHTDSEELFALTPGGLSGYVLKRVSPARILEPVESLLGAGRIPVDALARSAHSFFQRLLEDAPAGETAPGIRQLTQREQEVMEFLRKGYVEKEIARALAISTWTVHEHVKRIFEKLQVHSRTEAVLAYLQK